ncbi:MAG: hypothetical protein K0M64_00005 [Rhizobium sp.]|nr:hypothetical protein [Rhizobium sp.]
MDSSAKRDYLDALLDYAFDMTYVRSLGENHVEFLYVQCARVAELDDTIRLWLLEAIERSLVGQSTIENGAIRRPDGFIPSELVLFLAHRTKWPEFDKMADRISSLPEDIWRSNPLCRSSVALREALRNDWEHSDFYSSFSSPQPWPN